MYCKKSILLFLFLTCVLMAHSQYQVRSENIIDADKNIEYVKNNADFWIKHAYDSINSGFYSSIDIAGNVQDFNKKSLIVQSRHGYGFTRAFMLTGDQKYLQYASKALNFLINHGWDKVHNGWYTFAKADGSIDNRIGWNPNNKKYGFQQHYAMLGLVANYEATRNQDIKLWVDNGLNSLNTNMWDSRYGYEGYFEDAAIDWSTKTGKGFTPTVDAITTHAELMYLITQNNEDKERLIKLANIIVDRLVSEMDNPKVKILFPGAYNTDWEPNYNSGASVGHFIKTAWCLGRVYLCDTSNTQFRDAATKILDKVWSFKNGSVSTWDTKNGGPFNQVIPTTGTWGTNGDSKDYWTVEQGFMAPIINYYITQNPIYLQMADESMSFFMSYMVDKTNGEIFSRTNSTGSNVTHSIKGDDFKASYHSIEMGYLGYLYSKLYFSYQPATLYYQFEPQSFEQNIKLTPIPYQENLLKIKQVDLNDDIFTTFDRDNRTLNIPANVGGKFKVTFDVQAEATSFQNTKTNSFPFLTSNKVKNEILIPESKEIKNIQIYDLSSKLLFSQAYNNTSIAINVNNFKSGIYLLKMQLMSGDSKIIKIIKL